MIDTQFVLPHRFKNVRQFNTQLEDTIVHIDNWHSKICKLAGKAHPNIYMAVELFKAEQTATEVSLMQLASRRNTSLEEKEVLKA